MSSAALSGAPAWRPALKAPGRAALAHLPGDDGLPLVGDTFSVLADPLVAFRQMVEKYGLVYRTRAFGQRTVGFLGPEGLGFLLSDQAKLLSSAEGWGHFLGLLFPRGLMLLDFDEHRLHRRALSVAFKAGPLKSYFALLNAGIAERLAVWRQSPSEFLFYPAIKQLTLDLAAAAFLGATLGREVEGIKRAFIDMVTAGAAVIRRPLPGTSMRRGVLGREVVVDYFNSQVPLRREQDGQDLFSQLCRATHEDGSLMTAQEIADHMSFLMMAAHDTLASSISALVHFLMLYPKWQERLRAEIDGLGLAAGEPLPFEHLDQLPLTEMAFKEAMRLIPPVVSLPRRAQREFQFGGHRIPAGTDIFASILFTHHMPELWPEPERFDPTRFSEKNARDRHRFAYAPFGGGAHMCIGLHFASMQAKCFIYHLLGASRIAAPAGYQPRWQMLPIPKPRDGLRVSLLPRP